MRIANGLRPRSKRQATSHYKRRDAGVLHSIPLCLGPVLREDGRKPRVRLDPHQRGVEFRPMLLEMLASARPFRHHGSEDVECSQTLAAEVRACGKEICE